MLTGSGVAPVASVPTAVGGYALIGAQNTLTLTVSNTGNGDLVAPGGTAGNLFGTIGTASASVFTSTATPLNLYDFNSTVTGKSTAATSTFTYAPTGIKGATTTATVTTTLNNGIGTSNAAGTAITTLTGTLVAPVASLSTTNPGYVLVGRTGTGAITVTNTGNGNLSNLGTISNLRGTIAGAASGITGTGQTLSLADSASATSSYSFSPTTKGQTASQPVVASFVNGTSTGANTAFSQTLTLTGTGVAPVQSVTSTTGLAPVRVGTSATDTVTVSNTGNGNLSGLGSISNLNGAVSSSLATGMTAAAGNAASLSLPDSATSTLSYTYSPTQRSGGTVTSTVTLAFSNGNANLANTAQTVSSVFVNQAVGPQYASALTGTIAGIALTPTANTPTATAQGAIGPAGATISFGTIGYKNARTLYLDISNISTDPNGGNAALTNLSIENFSITGANASYFSVGASGAILTENGGLLALPITVVNNYGSGALNAFLTVFTDKSSAYGGIGDSFTYALSANAIPEPASIAILGAGLAGLVGLRRRRKLA